MYYIKYNEIDLTSMVKVREVEIPSLPSIEHSSIDMFERDGEVYNGASYGTREIKLTFIIKPDNKKDYEQYVRDVKRAFYTKEECRLFCGDEKLYIWCVPEGEMVITELGSYCAEAEVNLIAYDPYWYNTIQNGTNNEGSKRFTVTNNGDVETYPIINLGFTKDATFAQITNQESGDTILLGGIPSVEGTTIKANTKILDDNMESTTGWSSSTAPIDSGRSTEGSLSVTSGGSGLMCGNFGSSSSGAKWHGACYRKSINQSLTNFKVKVKMSHKSTGINGDPDHPYTSDPGTVTSGGITTYYKVNDCWGTPLRTSANPSATIYCTIPYGSTLTGTITNNWLKTTYGKYTGYCHTYYLKEVIYDTTTTTEQCNYVTLKNTPIRADARTTATNKRTIPAGTCIRVITSTRYPTTSTDDSTDNKEKFFKLAVSYEGVTGYVLIEDLIEASEYAVEYEPEKITADDKTGVVELYGFSANNVQLFKLSMVDDNEYYEFTYPLIRKNGENFLVDKTVAPAPKTTSTISGNTEKIKNLLSGEYGDWNDFYGELYIERINDKWYAYVQKIKDGVVVKTIKSNTVADTKNKDEKLNYLVMYIGTTGNIDKASGMSISGIEVRAGADIDNTVTYNFQNFEVGDVVTIDNNVPAVYINDVETNEIIDIGSSFFPLLPGENTLKVASDDKDITVDVLWNDRNL